MKSIPLAFAAWLALAAVAPNAPAAMPSAVGDTPVPSLSPMIKKVSPAIVNIATRGTIHEKGPQNPLLDDPFFRRFFDVPQDSGPRERPFQSAGSGVIFDAKAGYIVTNAHVVENASEITVTLQDGRDLKADIVGSDEPSDVAVLKVKTDTLTQISLGDSAKVEVGDFVVAIGNPFGLQHTVTSGIISGLSRSGINPDGYEDFIQTDASINPGNSGGALVDIQGRVIGIPTLAATDPELGGSAPGIGFALPSNLVKDIAGQIAAHGNVVDSHRAYLGVTVGNAAGGVMVASLRNGGPAAPAGIRVGDVIVSVDGKPTSSTASLSEVLAQLKPGQTVAVAVLRQDGTKSTLHLRLGTLPGSAS
jgi:serine protease Do/serine protease DegQ